MAIVSHLPSLQTSQALYKVVASTTPSVALPFRLTSIDFCRNPSFGLATKARGCKGAGVKRKEAQESKGRKPGSKGKGIGRVRAKRKPGSHHILPGV
jgi:hypothetical protein